MSYARHRMDIETDFFDRFPTLQPDVDITGENSDFEPKTGKPWIRISTQAADTFRQCISTEMYQSNGITSIQIFTPTGEGARRASLIADSVLDVFKTAKLNAIEFLDYIASPAGQNDGYYQFNVIANYRAYD